MGWHQIPEFDSVSSADNNPFAGSRAPPTGKVSVRLPVDDWLCRKMEKLNITVAEGYPSKSTEPAGLLRDQFVKTPRSFKWYDMHVDKKECGRSTVCSWSPEPAKLNSTFSRVARRILPTAPPSRALNQDILRRWERAAREQSIMCNQAAGLSQGQNNGQKERDCIFTCKLLCCKCSFCHRVAAKERRKSQLLSKLHRNKICERCFLCRSLEFCKSCHKCPNCCYNFTCRVKVTSVLGEVGSSGFKSKGSHNAQRGLHPPLPVQTKFNQVTNCHKQLCQSTETCQPFGGTVPADEQKCSRTGTQTQQPVETYPGPEHLEHLPKHRVFQNGDPRDNKHLPTARGVGHLHRLQGRILPYTNSQSVQEVHAFSHPGSILPVQSPTIWPVHRTYGVHSGGQRGQTDGFTERYKNPPVPR